MAETTIYITRHGQVVWNVEERLQGHQDSPLTDLGVRQAGWLRDALQHVEFAAIYASSSNRARRTAEIVRHQRKHNVICLDDLREIHMGDWEGQLRQEVRRKHPAAFTAMWEAPHLYQPENGGESYYDVQKRVIPLITSLISKHEGETILVVTHAVSLKLIMSHFEGRPLAQLWNPPFMHPTALSKVVIENQRPRIELHGDISHYREMIE